MVASIPASAIVNILPGVISAGGTGLDMIGLILTTSTRAPSGSILRFSDQTSVAAYFGGSSAEASAATTYFNGYIGSFTKPAFVLFASYAAAARSGFLRGGALGLTLTELQAFTGTLTINFGSTPLTSATITLAAASSFSNAAALIQAGFTAPGFTVTYDSVADAFLFTSTATGAGATIVYATGTLATSLNLTQATAATLSQGVIASVPGTAMDAIIAATQDFVAFTTLYAASDDDIVAFATWNGAQQDRFLYVAWTANSAATTNSDTTSPAVRARDLSLSGTEFVYSPTADKAIFELGYIASIDFNRANGRAVAAFRSGSGLLADVTNRTIADNLLTNGYSFYGSYATANDQFTWIYNGQVSGPFAWVDSYINQIWLNNRFQLSLMTLLASVGQIPYNDDGYELLAAGITTDILAAVNFGAIRAGVVLSESQKAQINGIAGTDISDVMFTRGWFLSILDPGPSVRAARGSPVSTFFYTDGQSVQKITLSSLQVQ